MTAIIAGSLAIIFYLGGTLLQYINLTRSDQAPQADKRLLGLGLVAVLAHLGTFPGHIFSDSMLRLGIVNAASLAGCLVVAITLISSLKKPLNSLFIVLFPLAALTLALSLFGGDTKAISVDTATGAHIVLSILAYSTLTIAAVQALLVAYLDNHLHRHQANALMMRLPPLQSMEQLLFEWLGTGLLLLTAAIVSGFLFLDDMFAQKVVHKTVLSLIAWVILAALLIGRLSLGWRGKLAVRLTLGSYVLLLLAYFGSKFVLELILQGGSA